MATTVDFIEYVCEQISGNFAVRYKKMFGEYMVYANDKPIFLVCNNCVYVKKSDAVADVLSGADVGVPYGGAKEHYILDTDNTELVIAVAEILERITPLPKKKNTAKK